MAYDWMKIGIYFMLSPVRLEAFCTFSNSSLNPTFYWLCSNLYVFIALSNEEDLNLSTFKLTTTSGIFELLYHASYCSSCRTLALCRSFTSWSHEYCDLCRPILTDYPFSFSGMWAVIKIIQVWWKSKTLNYSLSVKSLMRRGIQLYLYMLNMQRC